MLHYSTTLRIAVIANCRVVRQRVVDMRGARLHPSGSGLLSTPVMAVPDDCTLLALCDLARVFAPVLGPCRYKNVPFLKQVVTSLAAQLYLPAAELFEWLERHTQIRMSILLTCEGNDAYPRGAFLVPGSRCCTGRRTARRHEHIVMPMLHASRCQGAVAAAAGAGTAAATTLLFNEPRRSSRWD